MIKITNQDASGTPIADGDELNAENYNDTLNAGKRFSYFAGGKKSVADGLTMTGTGAQTINVASGYFVGSDGITVKSAGDATLALSAADGSNPRLDLITITDAGVLTVTDGTPANACVLPSTPADHTVLGYVYRAVSDNTTTTNDVGDMRTLWSATVDKIFSRTVTSYTFRDHDAALAAGSADGTLLFFPTQYDTTYKHFVMTIKGRDTDGTLVPTIQVNWNVANGNADYSWAETEYDGGGGPSWNLANGTGDDAIVLSQLFTTGDTGECGAMNVLMHILTNSSGSSEHLSIRSDGITVQDLDNIPFTSIGFNLDTPASITSIQICAQAVVAIDSFEVNIWGYK